MPMLVGIWMSFLKLTKFYIANWRPPRSPGFKNYAIALDFDARIGAALLQSFLVTFAFTLLVVGISWALGMAAAVALQQPFRGRGFFRTLFLVPYALPIYAGIITWNFMLQKDTGAGQPRPRRQPPPDRRPSPSGCWAATPSAPSSSWRSGGCGRSRS